MRSRWWIVLLAVVFFAALAPADAQQRTVVLRAWTIGPDNPSITRFRNLETAAERLNAELRREGANTQVRVEGFFDTTNWDSFLRRVLLAFQGGDPPDIVQASAALASTWATAGFISPLDEYIPRHPQFADVYPALWTAMRYQGKTWAIPQDTEARPLYFNKFLLRRLGWNDQQIADLPKRIISGDFTWDDVMTVAREARQRNVIEPGRGYYHRPVNGPDFVQWYRSFGGRDFDQATGKLVFNRAAALRYYRWLRAGVEAGVIERDRLNNDWNRFHQPITDGDGRVLFWSGGTWNWAEWEQQWVATKGGEPWLFERFGFAPHPSYTKGGKPITLSNPQAYMLAARSRNKDLAMRLLALTTVPDLDAKHAVGSAHLPVLRRTAAMVNNRFLKEVSYLLDYTTFLPIHPDLPRWQDAFYRGVSAAESGSTTPEQAVELVATELQRMLGDKVIIE
ncbi:MAG: extracellular solute-binding protein [Armatimonadota bacterium]|nr:extracellular solute-binding protein [Armatimonadota bacterium]MDR7453915.1 extracellular solute-binding protein [Armatimonadota bacterium]MDR7497987.1 extracellular solute-binding protein [Armatimonadota bacterium]MDR7511022.1 extracellular solute-binding protein [Armatimonadota bacterium]